MPDTDALRARVAELETRLAAGLTAAEGLCRVQFQQNVFAGHGVDYNNGWDAACAHITAALTGGQSPGDTAERKTTP